MLCVVCLKWVRRSNPINQIVLSIGHRLISRCHNMPAFFVELKQKITAHKLDKSLLPVVEVYKNKLQHISHPLKEKTNSKKNLAAAAVDGSATDNITSLCLAQMKEKGVLNLMAVVAMATTSFLENGRQVLSSQQQRNPICHPQVDPQSPTHHPSHGHRARRFTDQRPETWPTRSENVQLPNETK